MLVLILFILLCCNNIWATAKPPELEPQLLKSITNTYDLSKIKVSGSNLRLIKGTGYQWQQKYQKRFKIIAAAATENQHYQLQYNLIDLDSGKNIVSSPNLQMKIFGASVSKIFVAATLLDQNNGIISRTQLQQMADMIVVSSNVAWFSLQKQIGKGVRSKGQQAIWDFSKRMGYERSRPFQGWLLGKIHGNELNVIDLSKFLYDTYHQNYPGATLLWKLLYASRTGGIRGKKFISATQFVGGKTGSYAGTSANPKTGDKFNPDGSRFMVNVYHHVLIFNKNGTQYGIVVLNNTGKSSDTAIVAGGLYHLAP